MSVLKRARDFVRKFDSLEIYNFEDGSWKFYDFGNAIFSRGEPIGRYVFWRDKDEVPVVVERLKPNVNWEGINCFKHARAPLEGGDRHYPNLAVVVYANNQKHKEKVRGILDQSEIRDYEWMDGNPRGVIFTSKPAVPIMD